MNKKMRTSLRHVFSKSKGIVVGSVLISLIAVAALTAPILSPFAPEKLNVLKRLTPPSSGFLLGTDHLGRDLLSRVLHGARISLLVGGVTALVASVVGILLGLIGGYSRRLGSIVMRVVDGLMAFPGTLLALAMMAVLGARVSNIIIALSIIYAPRIARVEHATVLQVKTNEYVIAAVALGGSTWRVMLRHILPNTIGPILVQTTFIFAYAVIAEAGLSFIGVGAPADVPSWGNILSDGRKFMLVAPWITIIPGLAIFFMVLGLNLIGDGLRDVFDPKLKSVDFGGKGTMSISRDGT